jgi:hypothetical protein
VLVTVARLVLGLLRRGADLAGELFGQPEVAGIDLRLHAWPGTELLGDALGAHGGLVVHPAWADQAGQQQAALAVAERGGLDGVLLAFAGHERPAPGAVGLRAADLGLGPVEPQLNALRLGIGEDVFERLQPQAGPVGHGETTGCQQRADLADGRGDGGAIHLEEFGEHRVR